jgi:hypothetical protein
MSDPVVVTPAAVPPAQVPNNGEVKKEVSREEVTRLEKMVNDSQEMIKRQAAELGELRKSQPKEQPQNDAPDPLQEELTRELEAEGLDRETAIYNAKILSKAGIRTVNKVLGERMMNDVVDLVDEAMDDGKIDKAVFTENEATIMSEFKARKLAPTARKNYKILKDCYEIVMKRKAETLKQENERKSTEDRDKLISSGQVPQGGPKNIPDSNDDSKQLESIRNAGAKRSSVFF